MYGLLPRLKTTPYRLGDSVRHMAGGEEHRSLCFSRSPTVHRTLAYPMTIMRSVVVNVSLRMHGTRLPPRNSSV